MGQRAIGQRTIGQGAIGQRTNYFWESLRSMVFMLDQRIFPTSSAKEESFSYSFLPKYPSSKAKLRRY